MYKSGNLEIFKKKYVDISKKTARPLKLMIIVVSFTSKKLKINISTSEFRKLKPKIKNN